MKSLGTISVEIPAILYGQATSALLREGTTISEYVRAMLNEAIKRSKPEEQRRSDEMAHAFLRAEWGNLDDFGLADKLKRTRREIEIMRYSVGLFRGNDKNKAEAKKAFLRHNLNSMTYKAMAKLLNTTEDYLRTLRRRLGLTAKKGSNKERGKKVREYISAHSIMMSDKEMALALGISRKRVEAYRQKLRIYRRTAVQSIRTQELLREAA